MSLQPRSFDFWRDHKAGLHKYSFASLFFFVPLLRHICVRFLVQLLVSNLPIVDSQVEDGSEHQYLPCHHRRQHGGCCTGREAPPSMLPICFATGLLWQSAGDATI
jgi:hypothetical protein